MSSWSFSRYGSNGGLFLVARLINGLRLGNPAQCTICWGLGKESHCSGYTVRSFAPVVVRILDAGLRLRPTAAAPINARIAPRVSYSANTCWASVAMAYASAIPPAEGLNTGSVPAMVEAMAKATGPTI